MDQDAINVPEKIFAELATKKPKRGFPQQLDDSRLWGIRQHLRWLLETTWDEVGSVFPSVRTMAQLRNAIAPWAKRVEHEEHVIRALLRSSESPATSRLLYRQRKQKGELHTRYLEAYEWVGKCWDSLDRFLVIPTKELTPGEKDVIRDAIYERSRILAHAGEECIGLRDKEERLDELIRDGEAYFARSEFLRFCRANRYELNPLNTANALAGLPFIGYRHSARRCMKWPEKDSGGLSFEIFRILQKVVKTNVRRSDLVRDAETWLRARRPSAKPFAIAELRDNWYYLRRSISAVLKQGVRGDQLPGAISKEYWKRKSSPSAMDRAFLQDERIVM